MITAAVDHIPPPLLKQLKDGGRLALPLGNPFSYQNLVLVTKQDNDLIVKQITGVLFVPMTGYALKESSP
jgi:protein-L-isoaspartate(D-aspartate) O-methyltransferase